MRCKPPVRLGRVKTILHPYRVTVAASWDVGVITIRNNEKGLVLELHGGESNPAPLAVVCGGVQDGNGRQTQGPEGWPREEMHHENS